MNELLTKKQRTNLKLLEEANRQFSAKGYEATGVDSIVEALGLTSGVFYSHFRSKKDLLQQIIQFKTQKSKELFFTPVAKESAMDWVKRFLQIYLSAEHRDNIPFSCPLTTMSQELIKLNLAVETGLSDYQNEFANILNRRLCMISSQNQGKASSIIGLCAGAVILSRMAKDLAESNQILLRAHEAVMQMIVSRNSH